MASNAKRIRVTLVVDVDLETYRDTYGHGSLREAEQDALEHVPNLVTEAGQRALEAVANGATLTASWPKGETAATTEQQPKLEIRELNGAEIELLHRQLEHAHETGRRVRAAWDDGLKVKVGEGTWTPPLGEVQ